jgi:FlaA1/EpsC-like NDP-sugar epimerase
MLRSPQLKNTISFFLDAAAAILASFLALYMRLGNRMFSYPMDFLITQAATFTVCVIVVNYYFKVHKGIWRYFNLTYLEKITKASTIATLLFLLVLFIDTRLEKFPRSVVFLNWLLIILFQSLPRAIYTAWFNGSFQFFVKNTDITPTPILIIGLGNSTELFINELGRVNAANYKIVGILDSKSNVGRTIHDIPIIGTIDNIEKAIKILEKKKQRPARILISPELYIGGKLQKLLQLSEELSIPISKLPKLTELQHNLNSSPIQSIPIEDLLRRHQRVIDRVAVANLVKNKKVLITGAGGSIGSEIVRQVANCLPKEVWLLDNSEFLLYEIEQETLNKFPQVKSKAKLADIRDEKAISKIFKDFKPDIIFHAAALKHVPLLEAHKSEAVHTNILGTKNLFDAAVKVKAKNFIMISTDKAVNPVSFMGCTKRLAEMYCQSAATKSINTTIVRFGNVLGSNGSVVPIFEKQIASGGPITVTDAEATRYFMTIKEAVGLVLQATVLNIDNSEAKVFVLDMGEPIKVLDLANHMITLAGLKPGVDIQIKIIGLRPGEKLHEELYYSHENFDRTTNDGIFLAHPKTLAKKKLDALIKDLQTSCKIKDDAACDLVLRKVLK